MRTFEFIKKIEDLGFEVDKTYDNFITLRVSGKRCALVSTKNIGHLDTDSFEWALLSPEKARKAIGLICEFSSTPLKERGDGHILMVPKPYWSDHYSADVLVYHTDTKCYYLSPYEDVGERCVIHFTDEEIEELPNQDFIKSLIVMTEDEIVSIIGGE